MMRSLDVIGVTLILALSAACGQPGEEPSPTRGDGAESAVEAVERVHQLVREGDFDGAANLTVPNQAALASLAEGATFSDVATSLTDGDLNVAANFWSGFAQAAGDSFLSNLETDDLGQTTMGSTAFTMVAVASDDFGTRQLITRDVGGHRVDLFASFGNGLAARMISPVEILLTSATEDAALILDELNGVVDSLELAATHVDLEPDEAQSILQLIELITRVS